MSNSSYTIIFPIESAIKIEDKANHKDIKLATQVVRLFIGEMINWNDFIATHAAVSTF